MLHKRCLREGEKREREIPDGISQWDRETADVLDGSVFISS